MTIQDRYLPQMTFRKFKEKPETPTLANGLLEGDTLVVHEIIDGVPTGETWRGKVSKVDQLVAIIVPETP